MAQDDGKRRRRGKNRGNGSQGGGRWRISWKGRSTAPLTNQKAPVFEIEDPTTGPRTKRQVTVNLLNEPVQSNLHFTSADRSIQASIKAGEDNIIFKTS